MKVQRRTLTLDLPLDVLRLLTEAINETERGADVIIEEALRAYLSGPPRSRAHHSI